jgi:hypothetical protein
MQWVAILWALKRALVYLKRIAEAQASQAESLATLSRVSQDEWESKHAPRPRGKFVVGQMDVAEVNKRWRDMNKSEWDTSRDDGQS